MFLPTFSSHFASSVASSTHSLRGLLSPSYLRCFAGDGLCAFDVDTIILLLSDGITLHYLHNAARLLLLECLVERDRSEGGQVYNLGRFDIPLWRMH